MLLWPPRDADFQLQIVNFSRRKLVSVLRVDQVNLKLQKCYRERFSPRHTRRRAGRVSSL
jgi:hypothetical protein